MALLLALALALGALGVPGVPGAPAEQHAVNGTATADSPDPSERSTDPEQVRSMRASVQRGCVAKYSMTCLKLDALSVLGRMAVPSSYELLPGVSITRQAEQSDALDLPADLVRSLATENPHRVERRLDDYLMARFGDFLDSHSVQVHLLDLQPVASLRKALTAGSEDATGRRKANGLWQQLMGAGMMMGGSTLTMGLSALAAMAGKALMLSMLSLVLSALSGMNGGGGGGGGHGHSQKQTTYEIISKPIYTHGHSHSAELHHEPSGPGGPAAYGLYGRAKDSVDPSALTGQLSGASGVGSSGLGGIGGLSSQGGPSTYITQFPRSLQESAQQAPQTKAKGDDDKASGSAGTSQAAGNVAATNYDTLLIRNLQYVKGPDGRAKYVAASPAAPADLVPSETDYGGETPTSGTNAPRKYTVIHDDPAARSFQVSPGMDEDLTGTYEAPVGLSAGPGGGPGGPRSMHLFARMPLPDATRTTTTDSPWAAITTAPPSTSTSRSQLTPAFVVARAVVVPSTASSAASPPSPATDPAELQTATPRTVAFRAYS